MTSSHILLQPNFWKSFVNSVTDKKWKCPYISVDVIEDSFDKDALQYTDKSIYTKRRKGVLEIYKNNDDSVWISIILGACKEVIDNSHSENVKILKDLHIYEAFKDYLDHLDYFYKTAEIIDKKCREKILTDLNIIPIHDLDKIGPAMLVGYSERFEDQKNTSLWELTVDHHIKRNPHHQGHCLWHEDYDKLRDVSLKEMVCDKSSRKVQKEHNGIFSDEMFNSDLKFYNGLPKKYLDEAIRLQNFLRKQ